METWDQSRINGGSRARVRLAAFAFVLLSACGVGPELRSDDPNFNHDGGRLNYRAEPFTGTVLESIPALGEEHAVRYLRGLEHGLATVKSREGVLLASRAYRAGVKHGEHRTFFRDGKPRTYARFDQGRYVGEVRTWHENGRLADYKFYDETGEILVAKRWRPTGQIYMNFVFQDGAQIGLPGSKVCNPVGENPGEKREERKKNDVE